MDKITIKGALFLCNVGISERERRKKQKIFIDVELFLDAKKAGQTDDLKHTVDYSEVYDSIRRTIKRKKYRLIESIAGNIAKNVLNSFNVNKVSVTIKKPGALARKNVEFVALEIMRGKNG